jgi:hypothetical protein
MSSLAKKSEHAQAGHNRKRSLDAIAADIHQIERANIFAIGKLLAEAKDACEHGEWSDWLEDHFTEWSHDTALNYIAAYKLASKYERVRNLRVPSTIIYALGEDLDAPDLPAIIDALCKAAKGKAKVITVGAANEVIDLARLRIKFGDYPLATLRALDSNVPDDTEWTAGAVAALKQEQPDTDEAADKIVLAQQRKYVPLPPQPGSTEGRPRPLSGLEIAATCLAMNVDAEKIVKMLRKNRNALDEIIDRLDPGSINDLVEDHRKINGALQEVINKFGKQRFAVVQGGAGMTAVRTVAEESVAPDEERALLREFAHLVIGRARTVSFAPEDNAKWKSLRDKVKALPGIAS